MRPNNFRDYIALQRRARLRAVLYFAAAFTIIFALAILIIAYGR